MSTTVPTRFQRLLFRLDFLATNIHTTHPTRLCWSRPMEVQRPIAEPAAPPTFSAFACGDFSPLLVPAAALDMLLLMLLASSLVKELTLILRDDRLLAAPLPLPLLGGKPPKPALLAPSPPPAAAAALNGPGPAAGVLVLLVSCRPDAGCFALVVWLVLVPGERKLDADCCCWWSAVLPAFLAYCTISSLCSFLVKPCMQQRQNMMS